MGKIIAALNLIPRSGSTTSAIALASYFSLHKNRKTLFVNYSYSDKAEFYLGNIEKNNGLDYISALECLDNKKVDMYSISLNDNLRVVTGFSESNIAKGEDAAFIKSFLTVIKESFDYTIIDLSDNYLSNQILDNADKVLKLVPVDVYITDDYFKDLKISDNELYIISAMFEALDALVEKHIQHIKDVRTVRFSPDICYEANIEKDIYSYLADKIKSSDPFVQDILDLVEYIDGNEKPVFDTDICSKSLKEYFGRLRIKVGEAFEKW